MISQHLHSSFFTAPFLAPCLGQHGQHESPHALTKLTRSLQSRILQAVSAAEKVHLCEMANPQVLTQMSRKMAHLLRHNPPPEMASGGYVPMPVVLRSLGPHATEALIRQIVATDNKGRYQIDDSVSPPQVRAVQGHSVDVGVELAPVSSAADVPLALHITSEEGWGLIQQSGELRRMSRTHIHFATQPNHLRANSWATVLLQLDVPEAMAAGHELLLAANRVLLIEGPLPVQYVQRVAWEELPADWQPRRGRRH